MTIGQDLHVPPHVDHHKAFMNQHWINQWKVVSLAPPEKARHTLIVTQDEPISSFHRLLSEKFLCPKSGRAKLNEHLKFRIPGKNESCKKTTDRDLAYEMSNQSFVEGHMVQFSEVQIASPIIMVNMYSEIDSEDYREGTTREWWLPIEQVFWYPTLDKYRKATSLLKCWAPYSNLAVGVIPAGAAVKFKAGLIAPKLFPIPDDDIKNIKYDMGVRLSLAAAGEVDMTSQNTIGYATEFLKGGATQFYIYSAERGVVFDIGRVVNVDSDTIRRATRRYINKIEWRGIEKQELDKLSVDERRRHKEVLSSESFI